MSTMAEVLAAHQYDREKAVCTCSNEVQVGLRGDKQTHPEHVAEVLTKAGYGKLADAFPIIRDLADPEDCWFDHHGGCQAHGYLSLEPGETCPQHDAKEWLKANEGSAS